MKIRKKPEPNIKIHPAAGTFFTDCPLTELGDIPNKPAPVREVKITNFDGDKWCNVIVENIEVQIKIYYLYKDIYDLYDGKSISFDDVTNAINLNV